MDLSPSMVDLARKKLGDRADLRLGDAAEMPFADNSFDLVLSFLTLHEMPPAVRTPVMKEIVRVAGTDGRATGLVTLRDLAAVPVSERYTTSVRTVARPLDELPAVAVQEPAAALLSEIGSAPLAVVWDGSLPVGTVTISQFGAAVESARLLARLRGEQQPAA